MSVTIYKLTLCHRTKPNFINIAVMTSNLMP